MNGEVRIEFIERVHEHERVRKAFSFWWVQLLHQKLLHLISIVEWSIIVVQCTIY